MGTNSRGFRSGEWGWRRVDEPKEKGEKEKLGNLTSSNRSKHIFR
jgi:hypothetical protein